MNKAIHFAIGLGLAFSFLTAASVADDTNSDRPVMTYKQKMKDCMEKERQANPSASTSDRKKTCAAKIQSYDEHPSETKKPPSNPTP
jgi:hypothetical protein